MFSKILQRLFKNSDTQDQPALSAPKHRVQTGLSTSVSKSEKKRNASDRITITVNGPNRLSDTRLTFISGETNQVYSLDLDNTTCTCWDFGNARKNCPKSDIRRYCRHLLQFIDVDSLSPQNRSEIQDLVVAAFENYKQIAKSFPARGDFFFKVIKKNPVLIVQNPDSGWFDIYCRQRRGKEETICSGPIKRHGYIVEGNRWAWGDSPYNPLLLKSYIRTLPSYPRKESQKTVSSPDRLLKKLIKAPPDLPIHTDALDEIINQIRICKNSTVARAAIEKLGSIVGIPDGLQAKVLNDYNCSKEDLKRISHLHGIDCVDDASQADVEKVKLNAIIKTAIEMTDFNTEKMDFDSLPDSETKKKISEELGGAAPEWYSKDKGHTYWGYKYRDALEMARKEFTGPPNDLDSISNYLCTLILIDATVSPNQIAHCLRVKAEIHFRKGKAQSARRWIDMTFDLNPKINAKRLRSEIYNHSEDIG